MKDLVKSALWALTSIPITLLGLQLSFALAHGSLPFMLILLAPGLLVLSIADNYHWPESALLVCGFSAQYLGYFIVIHGAKRLVRTLKARNHSTPGQDPHEQDSG